MVMSWFNPKEQLSTTQPLSYLPPSWWDDEENQEQKVKPVGCHKSSLIIETSILLSLLLLIKIIIK